MTTSIEDRFADLERLPAKWSGSERPSADAFRVARSLAAAMEARGRAALDVAPMADGGIGIYHLEADTQRGYFEVDNSGAIVVVTSRRGVPQYKELPEEAAVTEMVRFLAPFTAS